MKNELGQTEKEFLESYNINDYERPAVATDNIVFTTRMGKFGKQQLEVLLIKRKNHPWINSWSLPGGFMDIDETLEESAKRELLEETNLDNVFVRPVGEFSTVDRDPRYRNISFAFFSLIPEHQANLIKAGDDAKEAAWFSIRRRLVNDLSGTKQLSFVLENRELGVKIEYLIYEKPFKNGVITEIERETKLLSSSGYSLAADHAEILDCALRKLRTDIETLPIAFNLLSEKFEMREVREVYEAIWGRNIPKDHDEYNDLTSELDRANFQREMKKYLVDTGERKDNNKPGPSPKLYRFKDPYEYR